MRKLQYLLNPRQVFNLMNGGPEKALAHYLKVPGLLILCAGGDGTVGWVLQSLGSLI